jgi:hypothetical protein
METYICVTIVCLQFMVFTTKKKGERYSHTIAFKLTDGQNEKLEESLTLLNVRGKRTSDVMRNFIEKVHKVVKDYEAVKQQHGSLKKQLRKCHERRDELKEKIVAMAGKEKPKERKKTASQPSTPKPSKREAISPSKQPSKPTISTIQPEQPKKHGPPPTFCVRGLDFSKATDDSYCHEQCKINHSIEYKACQKKKR